MRAIQEESFLLLMSGAVLACGLLAVDLARGKVDVFVLAAAMGIIVATVIIQFILRKINKSGDPFFLPLAVMLLAIGLVMVYRLKPALFLPQAVWSGLGVCSFFVSALFFRRFHFWADYKYIWGVIGVALLLATALFGTEIGGHKSWLILGPVRFQPAEFAKLFIVLFLAGYLDERREGLAYASKAYGPITVPHPRFLAPLLAVWGFTMLMLVVERDLGSALFYFGGTVILTYIASGRKSFITWGAFLFIIGSVAAYYLFGHVRVRFDIWLNPWADPSGNAYQIVQSLFAFGSGGLMGSGLTYGFPDLIPEVHTDFIFAAIGEELGLLGAGAVIFIYILMVYRAFKVSLEVKDSFDLLLSAGLAVLLALQVFVIIGGVTKFMPLTGVTLPFVSYGGSSMVSTFIMLGILYALSEAGVSDA